MRKMIVSKQKGLSNLGPFKIPLLSPEISTFDMNCASAPFLENSKVFYLKGISDYLKSYIFYGVKLFYLMKLSV